MSKTQNQFANCLKSQNSSKILEICIKKMEDLCVSKNVFIKTIRLSMEVAALLLDLIPDLKVIHLIRDPRGIIYSRSKGRVVNGSNIEASAKSMCNRILMDVMRSYHLKSKYPGRMKTQLYEYLAENPLDSAYDLHRFTNTTVPPSMKGYVYNHTMSGSKKRGYYNTARENSTITSLSWRMRMKWEDVRVVDRQCQELYDHVGFIPFSDKSQLTNLSFKTRKKESPLFEKFWFHVIFIKLLYWFALNGDALLWINIGLLIQRIYIIFKKKFIVKYCCWNQHWTSFVAKLLFFFRWHIMLASSAVKNKRTLGMVL